jgi:5-formyltetrahydrofolate cyclo-ligase
MVIVPLLAVDNNGHRVGYGKGFYDRFLAECRIRCLRIGISLFDPVEIIEDMDDLDIALTHCLTPSMLLKFEESL